MTAACLLATGTRAKRLRGSNSNQGPAGVIAPGCPLDAPGELHAAANELALHSWLTRSDEGASRE